MNDWFEWNGKRCTDFGIHVSEPPPITIPAERVTYTNVPGRSGSLTMVEGDDVYDDMVLTATCWLADPTKIAEIAAWLKGSGKAAFANRPGGWYDARITNQISFEKILRGNPHRSFAVNFRCKPFWNPLVPDIEMTEPGSIVNPFCFEAHPLITVYGTGLKQTLMIGSYSLRIDEIEDHITIDCESLLACIDDVNASKHITLVDDDWPVLMPGTNMINWTSGINSIVIQPNWRVL